MMIDKTSKLISFTKFLQSFWRPVMAFVMVVVLILYLIVGFFMKTIYNIDVPQLPEGAWALLSIFAGSYTISRGAEKFSYNWNKNNWKNKNKEDFNDDQELS